MKTLMFPRFHLASPPAMLDRTLVVPVSPGVRHSLLVRFGMRLKRGFHQALVRLLSTTIVGVLSVTPLSTTRLSQCLGIRMRTRVTLVKTKAYRLG